MLTPPKAPGPVLQDVKKLDSYYFACGGLADLYKGQWTRKPGEVILVGASLASPPSIKRYKLNSTGSDQADS